MKMIMWVDMVEHFFTSECFCSKTRFDTDKTQHGNGVFC